MIVGQNRLVSEISDLTMRQRFPRFSIFIGPRGSNADEFAKLISGYYECDYIKLEDIKVDTIRNMIDKAYKNKRRIVYNIGYADDMSLAAKNALLKVCEEPPNNALISMALEDSSNTLETIRSRATIFQLLPYTTEELKKYGANEVELKVCSNPGEIDLLKTYDEDRFYKDMTYLANYCAHVEAAKALTLTNMIATKGEEDKYDIILSLKAMQAVYLDKCENNNDAEDITKYCLSVIEIGKVLGKLSRKGLNKQMLLDEMILNVRRVWK